HLLSVGQTVNITNVLNSAYDGAFTITGIPTANAFTFTPSAAILNLAEGTGTSVTATVTVVNGQTLFNGETVTISGNNVSGFNGVTAAISAVGSVSPGAVSFTYTNPTGNLGTGTGGTATLSGLAGSGGGVVNLTPASLANTIQTALGGLKNIGAQNIAVG